MNPLETYLKEPIEIRASGAAQLHQEAGISGLHFSFIDENAQALPVGILEK
jgi:hypothetical protein